jgi:hypothetical protein
LRLGAEKPEIEDRPVQKRGELEQGREGVWADRAGFGEWRHVRRVGRGMEREMASRDAGGRVSGHKLWNGDEYSVKTKRRRRSHPVLEA